MHFFRLDVGKGTCTPKLGGDNPSMFLVETKKYIFELVLASP